MRPRRSAFGGTRRPWTTRLKSSSRRSTSTRATLTRTRSPKSECIAGATAVERVGRSVVSVKIVGQRRDANQSFGRQVDPLDEQAEVFDAGHDRVHFFADSLAHVDQQLELRQLALGGLGPLLAVGAMLAEAN